MPVARYFLFVGWALVALLFGANWMWPSSTAAPAQQASDEAPANDVMLRIRSGQKWPDKVVFDTSTPTIVPASSPPTAVVAERAPSPAADNTTNDADAASRLDARAEVKPAVQRALPPRRQARIHRRGPQRAPADEPGWGQPTWVASNPGWSWNW